ncbi:MAG: 4-alpha-glucanotransferase [bacterium]
MIRSSLTITASDGSSGPGALHRLAAGCGLETGYTDGCGVQRVASDDVVLATLRALGVEVETHADVTAALETRVRDGWATVLAPVTVAWEGQLSFDVRVTATESSGSVRCVLTLERGEVREWVERLGGAPTIETESVGGRACAVKRVSVPAAVPLGYHELRVEIGARMGEALVIAAPSLAFVGDPGGVGLFVPLYALHSTRSWGIGDLTDLEQVVDWLGSTGARSVSTLPLLATDYSATPCDPSPYRPISRLFWNELFVDPTRLPEFMACDAARQLVGSEQFERRVARLEGTRLIDYPGALALKREVLMLLAEAVASRPGVRADALSAWERERPLAQAYATFRAECETAAAHPPTAAPPRDTRAAYRYHLYAQWVTEQQVARLASHADASGEGLYLDFPLGVHPSGFDAHHFPTQFAEGVTTGAPPDELFPSGQDWATPPPHPMAARRDGYRYLRAALTRHLEVASRLRIDHVMGVHRLFWLPAGAAPTDGVYVHYPANDVTAILCLESSRHRTRLVGENLGTVPTYVNETLEAHSIGGLHVAQFRVRPEATPPIQPAACGTVASLNTHDTATFSGYLNGTDIDDRVARGRLTTASAAVARRRRRDEWTVIAESIEAGTAPADTPAELLKASLGRLARSCADMVLVTLEDLWLEPRPHNVPGTGPERANWRRRARYSVEEFTGMPEVRDTVRRVAEEQARGRRERLAGRELA